MVLYNQDMGLNYMIFSDKRAISAMKYIFGTLRIALYEEIVCEASKTIVLYNQEMKANSMILFDKKSISAMKYIFGVLFVETMGNASLASKNYLEFGENTIRLIALIAISCRESYRMHANQLPCR